MDLDDDFINNHIVVQEFGMSSEEIEEDRFTPERNHWTVVVGENVFPTGTMVIEFCTSKSVLDAFMGKLECTEREAVQYLIAEDEDDGKTPSMWILEQLLGRDAFESYVYDDPTMFSYKMDYSIVGDSVEIKFEVESYFND